jgi:anti-sigma factor RsiW
VSEERDELTSAALDDALDRRGARRLLELEASDPTMGARRDELARADATLRRALARALEEPVPFALVQEIAGAREPPRPARAVAALLLAAALGAAATWAALVPLGGLSAPGAAQGGWVEDVAAHHHLYAAEEARRHERPAAEEDEIEAWLGGRLGRSLEIPDLGPLALRFEGARLVPTGEVATGLLVYAAPRGAVVTLGIAARPGGTDAPFDRRRLGALEAVAWRRDGLAFLLLGPGGGPPLTPIARLVEARR